MRADFFRRDRSIIIVVIAVVSVLRIWLAVNLPLWFIPWAGTDDGLFMNHAASLLGGHWLATYNQMTLAKGPGYPWFLALASLSGLPVSLCHVIFQIFGLGVLAWALFRLTGSRFFSVVTFTILALHPVGYDVVLQRVIRDQIYWAQTLTLFGLLTTVFLAPSRSRKWMIVISIAAGLCLGWTWLTREEGMWLLPGIAAMVLGGLLVHRQWKIIERLLIVSLACFAVLGLFRTLNFIAYDSFAGVETRSSEFQDALDALQSVQIGKRAFVPVSTAARAAISKVSPTFTPIAEKLARGSPLLESWAQYGCPIYPSTCGDIAGGWFMWALRDAAAQAGYFKSPAIASQKFEMIAQEVEKACASGALPCDASPIPLMAWTPGLLNRLPTSFLHVLEQIAFVNAQDGHITPAQYPAAGSNAAEMWSLLNYPRIAESPVTVAELAARRVRSVAIKLYSACVPVLCIVGLVAMLLLLIRPKRAIRSPVVMVTASAWAFVAARAMILALADASSFPAAWILYTAPANFCVIAASLLSAFAAAENVFGIKLQWPLRRRVAEEDQVGVQSQ